MKLHLLLFSFYFAFASASFAQKKVIEITIDEAKDHVGEKVTICSEVKETYFNSKAKGEPTNLNFGAPFPKQTFTVLIWKDDLVNFDYDPSQYLKGKHICVTGVIKLYKGKPEMELKTQYQIYE